MQSLFGDDLPAGYLVRPWNRLDDGLLPGFFWRRPGLCPGCSDVSAREGPHGSTGIW